MQLCFITVGVLPDLSKSDIDSGFRRIPLRPEDRWAAFVAFVAKGTTFISGHLALPFGAIASVHNWDRIGSLLCHLARRLLHLPVMRYVDDYFSCDRAECIDHALLCFMRLVRFLLGDTAVSASKSTSGMPLDILGLTVHVDNVGMTCHPSAQKVVKWSTWLQQASDSGSLAPGLASKLAGALSWASQNVFHRLGRAMLRPLFAQQKRRSGKVRTSLHLALRWWLEVLRST